MKKNGFTLVELLGVVVLMGLITAAIVVPIINQVNKTKGKLDKASERLLFSSLEIYLSENADTYKNVNGNSYYLTLEELKENGVLESDFLSKLENVDMSTQIKVSVSGNSYEYEIVDTPLMNIDGAWDVLREAAVYADSLGHYNNGTYINEWINQGDNPYVIYNNILWFMLAKNDDGTIKLVSNEYLTTITDVYSSSNFASESYALEWLNKYFISRLKGSDIIKTVTWNNGYEGKIGMISDNECYYLFGNSHFTAQNFLTLDGSRCVGADQEHNLASVETATNYQNIKAVINVYASSVVTGGNGSYANPYILNEVKSSKANQTIEQANLGIGTYLSIDNNLYRIIDTLNDRVKVISNYYSSSLNQAYSSTDQFDLDSGIGKYLKNNINSEKFLTFDEYLGGFYTEEDYYGNTSLSKKNLVKKVTYSLPKLGELFTAPKSCVNSFGTLTLSSAGNYIAIGNNYTLATSNSTSTSNSYLYTGYISNTEVIVSGNGTSSSPYVIE